MKKHTISILLSIFLTPFLSAQEVYDCWKYPASKKCKVYYEAEDAADCKTIVVTWTGGEKNGFAHGKGVLKYYEEAIVFENLLESYEGEVEAGKYSGEGVMTIFLGEGKRAIHSGQFKNHTAHGIGVWLTPDGMVKGEFRDGELYREEREIKDANCMGDCDEGYGRYKFYNGATYWGNWVEGVPQGEGRLVFDDAVFEGIWELGMLNGIGSYTNKAGLNLKGKWNYGNFISIGAEKIQIKDELIMGLGIIMTNHAVYSKLFVNLVLAYGKNGKFPLDKLLNRMTPTLNHFQILFNESVFLKFTQNFNKQKETRAVLELPIAEYDFDNYVLSGYAADEITQDLGIKNKDLYQYSKNMMGVVVYKLVIKHKKTPSKNINLMLLHASGSDKIFAVATIEEMKIAAKNGKL